MSNRICEHIQDDGLRCSNPTMYRRQVCFYHWQLHRPTAAVTDPAYVPPVIDSEASIVIACSHLLRAVLSGKIDLRRAQVAMSCLRQAATCFRQQQPAGEHAEVNFTRFMADYYSSLDEAQAQASAAYPDPHPLVYPAHFSDVPDDEPPAEEPQAAPPSTPAPPSTTAPAGLSSRAPLLGEGSASRPNYPGSSHDRGRAGLQPRVNELEKIGASAPARPTDKKPPLSAAQTKLLKKILRRGPSHPQFKQATRLLDHHIAATSA